MDAKLKEYFSANGRKGGRARAKKGKKALGIIAKKGWATRNKNLTALEEESKLV